MDEIDAALDFKNVSIVAHYIKVCVSIDYRQLIVIIINYLNRNVRKMLNLLLSVCVIICLSWLID